MSIDFVLPRLRFDATAVRRLMAAARSMPCEVVWVVDQGSYLTTEVPTAPELQVFAEGMNPAMDPEWQVRVTKLVGEDAFRERIAVDELEAAFALFPDATTFVMEIHREAIEIILVGPPATNGDDPKSITGAHHKRT